MLVLSRRRGENIVLPDLGVTIAVEQIRGSRVVLGVEAPRELRVLRGELQPRTLPDPCGTSSKSSVHVMLAMHACLMRSEYESALMRRGFQVVATGDSEECQQALRAGLPDVLVLEAELPPGGGDTVLEQMQDALRDHRIPVMVLTTQRNRSAMYRISRYEIRDLAVGALAAAQLADRVSALACERPSTVLGITNTTPQA